MSINVSVNILQNTSIPSSTPNTSTPPTSTTSTVPSTSPTDTTTSPTTTSPGGSVPTDQSSVTATSNDPGALNIENLPIPPKAPLQDEIKTAKAANTKAQAKVDDAAKAFKSQIDTLEKLGSQLQFAQGGDVDRITPNRGQRFDNEIAAMRKLVDQKPVPAAEITAQLAHMKTLLNPPATPLGPDGQSRNQQLFGPAVPGADKALAQIDDMIKASGNDKHHEAGSLWNLQTHAEETAHTVADLKELQKDGNAGLAKLDAQVTANQERLAKDQATHAKDQDAWLKARDGEHNALTQALMTDGPNGQSLLSLLKADNSPGGQEALADLKAAENASALGREGATVQFLQKLKADLANFPDSPVLKALGDNKTLDGLIAQAKTTAQTWHTAHDSAVVLHAQEMKTHAVVGARKDAETVYQKAQQPQPVIN